MSIAHCEIFLSPRGVTLHTCRVVMQPSHAPNRERFREWPTRLAGYSNEVGEAFRPLVPRWVVNMSYAMVSGYVVTDTAWRASTANSESTWPAEAFDSLLWHTLASVVIPGAAINRIVWVARRLVPLSRWIPTAIGLGCIPLIVEPIDYGVEVCMDMTVRPIIGHHRGHDEFKGGNNNQGRH